MKYFLLLPLLLFICSSNNNDIEENALITQNYESAFLKFQNELNILCDLINNGEDALTLQHHLTKTRDCYKKIEFQYDYYQTTFNYYNINGAPLPKFDQSYTNNEIYAPNGLQTLDELIFDNNPLIHTKTITSVAKLLKEKVDLSAKAHFPQEITDRSLFEAMRSGLVRIFALGVTGFDTPSSNNALSESFTSFNSIEQTFILFNKEKNIDKSEYSKIKSLFKNGSKQLKRTADFNSFDRMKFLKEVINPLYKELYLYQKNLGINTKQRKTTAQDYSSTNLFDIDFIDSNYYSYRSYIPLDNEESIALGKKLFNDPILSKNKNMSCATCHDSKKAFTDGLPKSISSIEGKFTDRNSPTLINVAFASRQFWDMRAFNLELQVAHVVGSNKEFNSTFKLIENRLKQHPVYKKEFENIYGNIGKKVIYERTISNAIAAYVSSLQSVNSEFDKFVRNETETYSDEAYNGFNLFMGKAACATCHFVPTFNGTVPPYYNETESEALGVTLGFDPENPVLDPDPGRLGNDLVRDDLPYFKESFKTVTLRNIGETAPYMHNGSFKTLEDVLEFYNLGGGAGMGLEVEYQTLPDTPLDLSKKEISDIIEFLHTLSDNPY